MTIRCSSMKYASLASTFLLMLAFAAPSVRAGGEGGEMFQWTILDQTISVTAWFEPGIGACGLDGTPGPYPDACFLGSLPTPGWTGKLPDPLLAPNGQPVDAAGNIWSWRVLEGVTCSDPTSLYVQIVKCTTSNVCTPVASVQGDCPNAFDRDYATPLALWVDLVNGYLYVRWAGGLDPKGYPHGAELRVDRFSGLPTLAAVGGGPPCPDADGDAWADCVHTKGCTPYGHPCGDCDDSDPQVNPNQSEKTPASHKKDHKDNDCNGTVDDWRGNR